MPDTKTTGVRRYDFLERLDGPQLLPNGWLRADALIARTGIQIYRRADGTVQRELRKPEHVFDAAALASFAMVPVTDDHPPVGILDAETATRFSRGHLGDTVRQDGDKVRSSVLITDGDLVKKVQDGKRQLSGGYVCDLDMTPGEWKGERYDCVQVNIRGNHVAVVQSGRAGPEVGLRLDSADAVSIRAAGDETPGSPGDQQETQTMTVKLKVDGVDVEFANEQGAQIVEKALAAAGQRADAAEKTATQTRADAEKAVQTQKAEADGLRARADVAEAKTKELEKARTDSAANLPAMVKARVSLEATARQHLGDAVTLDGMEDLEVKKAILAKVAPGVKLDGQGATYVEAAYAVALAQADAAAGRKGVAKARELAGNPPAHADADEHLDADEIRTRNLKKSEDLWKKPTVGASL